MSCLAVQHAKIPHEPLHHHGRTTRSILVQKEPTAFHSKLHHHSQHQVNKLSITRTQNPAFAVFASGTNSLYIFSVFWGEKKSDQ